MKSLTPVKPVMFKHEGGWKTGMLMAEGGVSFNGEGFIDMILRIVKLSCTGEIVMVPHTIKILDNPCREDERKAEAVQ